MKYMPLLCVLLVGLSGWAEDPQIRIQFTVGEALPIKKPGDEPRFPFKVEIINTSEQPIELIANTIPGRNAAPDDFISHTRNRIVFETKPALLASGFQTMATTRDSESQKAKRARELSYTLLPGKPLTIELMHNARRFMDEERLTTREIPIPGLYEFTASVPLQVKGGKEVFHTSNAQKVPVGGSNERPRNCLAKLIAYDAATGAATFEQSDPDFGNRVGDHFHLYQHPAATFVFKITELEKGKFKAVRVDTRRISGFNHDENPQPHVGSFAEIASEFDRSNQAP